MGKAARNERLKLEATFYNNIAVGLGLAGVFLPVLSILNNPPTTFSSFITTIVSEKGIFSIVAVLAAFFSAYSFYRDARKEIDKIED
jgi:hypothetical protein